MLSCVRHIELAKGSNFTKYAHRKTPGSNLCYKVFTSAPRLVQRAAQEVAIVSLPSTQDKPPKKKSLLSLKVLGSKNEILEIKLNFNISLVDCKISFAPLDDWGMGKSRIGDIPKNIERLKMVFTLPETVTLKSFVTELSCQPCTYNCTYYPNK